MKTTIKIQNLFYLSYLDDITFSVKGGEIVVLSSSDKNKASMLLSLISGLKSPDSGEVLYNGKKIINSSVNIGYIFNKEHIKDCCETLHNIPIEFNLNQNTSDLNYILINHYLQTFGLVKYDAPANQAEPDDSYIIFKLLKSLIMTPELLLIDEPFDCDNYQLNTKLVDYLYHVTHQENKICIFASSKPEALSHIADKCFKI